MRGEVLDPGSDQSMRATKSVRSYCRGRCLWTLCSLEDVHLSSGSWQGCASAFGLVFGFVVEW